MPTIVMSCEKDLGHVRRSIGCVDKELLTFACDTAICGISMLEKCDLKQGHMQMGVLQRSEQRACFTKGG